MILKAEFQFPRLVLHSLYLTYLTAFAITFPLVSKANNVQMWLGLHTDAKVTLLQAAPNLKSSTVSLHINDSRVAKEEAEGEREEVYKVTWLETLLYCLQGNHWVILAPQPD